MNFGSDELDQELQPFPLLWWHHYARFGTRQTCRKQLRLTVSIAELAWGTGYATRAAESLSIWAEAPDGTPVTTWSSPYSVLADVHHDQMRAAIGSYIEDSELLDHLATDTGAAWRLTSWWVLYWWFASVFQRTMLSGVAGDPSAFRVVNPEQTALGHADAALTMLEEDCPGGHALATSLQGGVRATMLTASSASPPPWNL